MLGDHVGAQVQHGLAVQREAVLAQRLLDVLGADARVGVVGHSAGPPAGAVRAHVVQLVAQPLRLALRLAHLHPQLVVLVAHALELVRAALEQGLAGQRLTVRRAPRLDALRRRAVEHDQRSRRLPALLDALASGLPAVVAQRIGQLAAVQSGHQQAQHVGVALLHPRQLDRVAAVGHDVLQDLVQPVAVAHPDRDDRDVGLHDRAVASPRLDLERPARRAVLLLADQDRGELRAQLVPGLAGGHELEEVLPGQLHDRPAEARLGRRVPRSHLALLVEREVLAAEEALDDDRVGLELLPGDAERDLGQVRRLVALRGGVVAAVSHAYSILGKAGRRARLRGRPRTRVQHRWSRSAGTSSFGLCPRSEAGLLGPAPPTPTLPPGADRPWRPRSRGWA